jgi:hypothetical protein
MSIKPSEIRETFANIGEGIACGLRTFSNVTNPNYHTIGHQDFHKKLNSGDVGYVSYTDKIPEADSIKSQEDWNKLCHSAKLEVFEKKFPKDFVAMSLMFQKYMGLAKAESKPFHNMSDWYGTMMQKYVEKWLPVKIWPKIK